jgi:predicted ATPase with chaperone activity
MQYAAIRRYRRRLSGPLLDRIDSTWTCPASPTTSCASPPPLPRPVGESREQRQPLEDGVVTISRAAGAPTFPHTVEHYAELKGYLAAPCP